MLRSKESTCQCRRYEFDPWVRKIPWRGKWVHTPVFLLGNNPMDRGAWGAIVHGITKELHDLATKQQEFRITVPNDTVREAELSISLQ